MGRQIDLTYSGVRYAHHAIIYFIVVRTLRSYTLFLTIITMKQMNKINFVSIELDL